MKTVTASYKRHSFPSEIIAHAVWLYDRFPLKPRLIEEVLLEPACRFPRKRSDAGAGSSALPIRVTYTASSHSPVMSGLLMRSASLLLARNTGSGEPSIWIDTCWTKSFKLGAIPRSPGDC